MKNSLISILKGVPVDFGQANLKHKTKGKKIALELINPNGAGKTALDVGCRDGFFTKILKNKGYKVISIDIEKNYDDCEIVDANDILPYKDNSFDLIWCSEVIEHLINPAKTINEFKRILKSNGVAVITTPNSYFWLFRILKLFSLTPQKIQNSGHLHFFNANDIKKFNPHNNIIYGFFPYFILKFKIKRFINLLSPTFIFIIKKQ